MKISCSTVGYSLYYKRPLAKTLETISEMGYENVEITAMGNGSHIKAEELRADELRRIKRIVKDADLSVTGIHGGGFGVGETVFGAMTLDIFKKRIDLAESLDASVIVGILSGNKGESLEPFVGPLKGIESYLKKKGIKMGIENHWHNIVESIEDARRIMDLIQSDIIGLTLDTGHFASAGEKATDMAKRLGEYAVNIHAKDIVVDHETTALGQGKVDFVGLVREMNRIKYDGYYTVEIEVKEDPTPLLTESRQYLEKILRQPQS